MEEKNAVQNKGLPHNIDAETYLLASLLLDPSSFENVMMLKLNAEDFFDLRHQHIFRAINEMNLKGRPIDAVTLSETLSALNLKEKSGGVEYISALLDKTPSSANIEYYGEIVKQKSMLRQLIRVSSSIISRSMDNPEDVKSLIDQAEKNIFDINQEAYSSTFSHIKQVLNSAIEELATMERSQGNLSGIPSGYPDLDEKTDGFQNSEMVIVAARPSAGKTSFVLNVACNSALRYGKKIGFFSCEMSKESLVKRMLCSEAMVDQLLMRKGMLSAVQKESM